MNAERWQHRVEAEIRKSLDPSVLGGRDIRTRGGLVRELFDARPEAHQGSLPEVLRKCYMKYESAAREEGRLSRRSPLVTRWTLVYDLFSPKLQRFIEVDERQHFSRPRLDRLGGYLPSGRPRFHPHFWAHVLPTLLNRAPVEDRDPPHRDEARAFRDEAREQIPLAYGLKPTIRIDEFTLAQTGRDPVDLIREMLRS